MSEKTPEQPQESEPTGPGSAEAPYNDTGSTPPGATPTESTPSTPPSQTANVRADAPAPLATESGQFRTTPLNLDVPFSAPAAVVTANSADASATQEYPSTRVYEQESLPSASPTAEYPQTQTYGARPQQTPHPYDNQTPPPSSYQENPRNQHHPQNTQRSYHPQNQRNAHHPTPPQQSTMPHQAARYPHHAQPGPRSYATMPPPRQPRRRARQPEPLTYVPITGSMPLTGDDVTQIPPDGPIEWPKRPVGFVGVANLILSAVMSVLWAWIPLGLLFTGIGGIWALGLGVLALVAWVLVQQVANVYERYRAELVYGDRIPVPKIARSTRDSGFTRFLHNRWLLVTSGSFWRSTAHHYVKMALGMVVVGGTFAGIGASITAIFGAINPDGIETFFLGGPTGGLGRIGVTIGALIILASSLAILWFAPYLDRALDRSLLPPPRTAALQAEVTELDRARMAGIDAAAAERLRIERDLHDGAQPRLVALTMTLGLAKSKIDTDPERAKELVTEAHAEAKGIVTELRQLARGIHPAVLTDRGLDAAVSALAGRSPIPVEVDVRLNGRIEREAEAVAYFVVAECLTNIAKHAEATHADVLITPTAAGVQIVVTDDGRGGARIDRSGRHTGIAGLVDRVEAARGTLNLTSPAGGPTTIVVEVPCAS